MPFAWQVVCFVIMSRDEKPRNLRLPMQLPTNSLPNETYENPMLEDENGKGVPYRGVSMRAVALGDCSGHLFVCTSIVARGGDCTGIALASTWHLISKERHQV